MWGPHSRQFWAYPCFDAPPGTILNAVDPSELAGMMRRVQRAVSVSPVSEDVQLERGFRH